LLLGDSITQMGSNEYDGFPGWVAHMQAHYNRKVGAAAVGVGVVAVGVGVAAGQQVVCKVAGTNVSASSSSSSSRVPTFSN
jgi:hypothetical protein